MTDDLRSWAVLDHRDESGRGLIHVVPWLGPEAEGDVAGGHEPTLLCPCRVRLLGDGRNIASHTQPDWPNQSDEAIVAASREIA